MLSSKRVALPKKPRHERKYDKSLLDFFKGHYRNVRKNHYQLRLKFVLWSLKGLNLNYAKEKKLYKL